MFASWKILAYQLDQKTYTYVLITLKVNNMKPEKESHKIGEFGGSNQDFGLEFGNQYGTKVG